MPDPCPRLEPEVDGCSCGVEVLHPSPFPSRWAVMVRGGSRFFPPRIAWSRSISRSSIASSRSTTPNVASDGLPVQLGPRFEIAMMRTDRSVRFTTRSPYALPIVWRARLARFNLSRCTRMLRALTLPSPSAPSAVWRRWSWTTPAHKRALVGDIEWMNRRAVLVRA